MEDDNTVWRRPIGCLKLQVIFRKRATNSRALWRKMTSKDKASYGSSPPCNSAFINLMYTVLAKMHSGIKTFTGFLFFSLVIHDPRPGRGTKTSIEFEGPLVPFTKVQVRGLFLVCFLEGDNPTCKTSENPNLRLRSRSELWSHS